MEAEKATHKIVYGIIWVIIGAIVLLFLLPFLAQNGSPEELGRATFWILVIVGLFFWYRHRKKHKK